ncbi:MAG: hypothetical protein ANABAC_1911 [Anaerolineae bacterium]|nr:MAG: hypothetical protein ANABAC_1911 [Anaerolineae bacterium]
MPLVCPEDETLALLRAAAGVCRSATWIALPGTCQPQKPLSKREKRV